MLMLLCFSMTCLIQKTELVECTQQGGENTSHD
jgi:hypothetical protein